MNDLGQYENFAKNLKQKYIISDDLNNFKFQALEVGIGKKLDEKSKSDVLELLSELEGELEGKDIAIATLKVNICLGSIHI